MTHDVRLKTVDSSTEDITMAKLILGSKERIVLLTIIAILLIAVSAYMGERFRPYKIAGNVGTYAVEQIMKADTKKVSTKTSVSARHAEYVVRKGDTIWSISQKYKVKPELLKFANYIGNDSKIRVGQKLLIPKSD